MKAVDPPATEPSLVRATWRALLAPKRFLPILVVSVPLIVSQGVWSAHPISAVPLGLAMVLAFLLVAPVSYRVLFPDGLELSHGAVRLVLYALTGAGVLLSVGVGVPKLLQLPPTFLTERLSLAVSLALYLVGGWGLARDIGFEARIERLTKEAETARLLALRAHLDPHFLFNTLNAIAEWCRTDGAVAEAAVLKLSSMLRTLLEGTQRPLWPLARELQLATTLCELHLMRDPSLFALDVRLPALPSTLDVPPLCVLTLVENAVTHGAGKGHRGPLVLEVRPTANGGVDILIENEGPFAGPRDGGVGLNAVSRQLQLAFGGRASLTVEAAGPTRTRASLRLPGAAP